MTFLYAHPVTVALTLCGICFAIGGLAIGRQT